MKSFTILAIACICNVSAFVAPTNQVSQSIKVNSKDNKFGLAAIKLNEEQDKMKNKILTSASVIVSSMMLSPLVSMAVEENYEYGAVDAPIGLAWGVGVLAIATASVPIFLKGGEEALDEMREREGNSFGSGKDALGGKGRRK